MTLEERIAERIALLEAERKKFIEEANQKLAAYEGAIGELKRLIEVAVASDGHD